MPRRRPDFEPGVAVAEGPGAPKDASSLRWAVAAKLKKFSDGGGAKNSCYPTPPEANFSSCLGIATQINFSATIPRIVSLFKLSR